MSFQTRLDRLLADQPPALADAIAASRMVLRVAHLLQARIDAALAPHGIDMRAYLALVLVADDAIEPLRPSDLSATLDATRTQVTRLLDALEAKGLTRRRPNADDRRSLRILLTDAGRAMLAATAPVVHAAYAASWAEPGPADTHAALGTLRRVHAALAPKEPEPPEDVQAVP